MTEKDIEKVSKAGRFAQANETVFNIAKGLEQSGLKIEEAIKKMTTEHE